MSHTKTPWRIELSANDPARIVSIHEDHDEDLAITDICSRSEDGAEEIANAELIVRAVNSYEAMKRQNDALFEALVAAKAQLEECLNDDNKGNVTFNTVHTIKAIEQVLAITAEAGTVEIL